MPASYIHGKFLYIFAPLNEISRYAHGHRLDFANKTKANSTALSQYIWDLKGKKEDYQISWKILKAVTKLKNGNKMCRLCVTEAATIMKGRKGQLNRRTEILNKCRHQNKYLLKNWKDKNK